jgi:hypothetical protein
LFLADAYDYMRRALRLASLAAAATAVSYAACLAALFVVTGLTQTLLAAFTSVEFGGLRTRWGLPMVLTRFPGEGSAAFYAFYQAGFVLITAAALLLAVVLQLRSQGWLRLALAHFVLWTGPVYALFLSGDVNLSGAGLGTALQVLWNGRQEWLLPFWIFGGAVISAAVYKTLRSTLSQASGRDRLAVLLGGLVLPLGILGLALDTRFLRARSLLGLNVIWWPAVLALLAGAAALWRSSPHVSPLRLSPARGLVFAAFATAAAAALPYWATVQNQLRRPELAEQRSRHWVLHFDTAIPQAQRAALASAADERLERHLQRLGVPPPAAPLYAYYYATAETKNAALGSDAAFTVTGRPPAAHHLLNPEGALTDARGDALLLLEALWGRPGSEPVARAIARYAEGEFYGTPLASYAARITATEGPYSLAELFGERSGYLSPLVRDALGAAWVESRVLELGPAVLQSLYSQPLAPPDELEEAWRRYQLAKAASPPAPPRLREPEGYFHRGISFSHEVGGDFGYGSERARRQLERMRATGANTVAIVPYAFTRAPRETAIRFGTDERDDRVIRAIQQAKQLGLRVMLKPQLWGPVFTGHIVFERDSEFAAWFGPYRRWLQHYARLAELFQVDLLVIGTELSGATSRADVWRSLITDLRRIYSGPLTYAASWGPEFEELPFWDALDYLAVNMYYPLAAAGEAPRADSPQVQALVEKFAAAAARHDKPLLFTEIGYPAQSTAALRPWDWNGSGLDTELQGRCYEAVFAAFYRQPWFAGLYWWKWPSHGEGSRFDSSFNPLGKPALEVLTRWYREDHGTPLAAAP